MKQGHLFRLATAGSVCIFVLALSTYFVVISVHRISADSVHFGGREVIVPRWTLSIGDGVVSLGVWDYSRAAPPTPGVFTPGVDWFAVFRPILIYAIPDALWGFKHFTQRFPQPGSPTLSWVTVPVWPVLLAAGILPALWWRQRRLRRLRARDLICLTCGYDLRATPDRCPECGTVASQPVT